MWLEELARELGGGFGCVGPTQLASVMFQVSDAASKSVTRMSCLEQCGWRMRLRG